ncbi:hypothetical protein FNV43_RR06538 [Rhamnella rubrinervis]|uniref:Gnk2-homologous domain-containing protein n=1 Tax=Rhamnella rubrinervis TaxID=2594499 RepID=A0A8K0MM27_9ROSA|nr:hypothetical protein FNV43_RR06538 [Rhamnella rubrinervis]
MDLALRNSICLFLIFIAVLITQAIAQPSLSARYCDVRKNYTTNSTYQANLNHLLSTFPPNIYTADHTGFFNSIYGQNSDKVYAMGLCRGDVKPEACRSCLNYSTNSIKENCPNQKEAIEWYAECMLRYSNRSIFGVVETNPRYWFWNVYNVTSNVDDFNQVLNTLLSDLKDKAAAGGSLLKHATGNETAPNFQTIYAQLQCTPDLSQTQCTRCLDVAMADIPRCCDGKQSAAIISPSCNLRFEPYLFYEASSPIADAPPPSPPPPSINNRTTTQGKKSNTSRTIIIVVVPTVVCVVLIISICACLRIKRKEGEEEISN